MSEARVFIVARSQEKGYAKLVFKPGITPDELELEGASSDSGYWIAARLLSSKVCTSYSTKPR